MDFMPTERPMIGEGGIVSDMFLLRKRLPITSPIVFTVIPWRLAGCLAWVPGGPEVRGESIGKFLQHFPVILLGGQIVHLERVLAAVVEFLLRPLAEGALVEFGILVPVLEHEPLGRRVVDVAVRPLVGHDACGPGGPAVRLVVADVQEVFRADHACGVTLAVDPAPGVAFAAGHDVISAVYHIAAIFRGHDRHQALAVHLLRHF